MANITKTSYPTAEAAALGGFPANPSQIFALDRCGVRIAMPVSSPHAITTAISAAEARVWRLEPSRSGTRNWLLPDKNK
jgi:hypothetical protein